jgi:hypothetical protein
MAVLDDGAICLATNDGVFRVAAGGQIDVGFGDGGVVDIDAHAVARGMDGSCWVAHDGTRDVDRAGTSLLERLDRKGRSLVALDDVPNVRDLAPTPEGGVVAVYSPWHLQDGSGAAVRRYDASGALDLEFGGGEVEVEGACPAGCSFTALGALEDGRARAVFGNISNLGPGTGVVAIDETGAVQWTAGDHAAGFGLSGAAFPSDGSVIRAGGTDFDDTAGTAVAAFETLQDGVSSGPVSIGFPSDFVYVLAAAVDAEGRLLLAGMSTGARPWIGRASDGAPDPTWGVGGESGTELPIAGPFVSVEVATNGTVVAAGVDYWTDDFVVVALVP